ncbi:GNAT family N-acetyltransferase [Thalassotalea montiporae]
MKLYPQFFTSCAAIDEFDWQRCFPSSQPFTQYNFISTLECTGCVSKQTGWQPCHLALSDDSQQVVAIVILYIKSHSYGEYLFDWSWADAFYQHGIEYYPKIVSAIPFTPVTGARFGIAEEFAEYQNDILSQATQAINSLAKQIDAQTAQCLFLTPQHAEALADNDWLKRCDVQYHWFNRNYGDFSEFLAQLTARKRKSLSKERQAVVDQGIEIRSFVGEQLTKDHWREFYRFYQATYMKRSGHQGYLTPAFFDALAQPTSGMSENSAIVFAYRDQKAVAAALFFYDNEQLYGRYWGAEQAFNNLHFELCYYQGIELCIKLGLSRFNAGAQGQHKLKRGFEPVYIYGSYQVYQPVFHQAISDFIAREHERLERYTKQAKTELPFRKHQ